MVLYVYGAYTRVWACGMCACVATAAAAALLPGEGEFGKSILAVQRVNGDFRRAGPDLDDTAAAFLFRSHHLRPPFQLRLAGNVVRNLVRRQGP